MLKQNWRFVSRVERLGDVAIIVLAFFAAYHGRGSLLYWNDVLSLSLPLRGDVLAPVTDYLSVLLLALAGYVVSFECLGAYGSMRLFTVFTILRLSATASAVVFVLLATTLFALKSDVSRSFIGLFCLFVTLFITLERYVVLNLLRYWRRRGRNFRRVVLCGIGEHAARLAHQIALRPELGLGVSDFADLRSSDEIPPGEAEAFVRDVRGRTGLPVPAPVVGEAAVRDLLERVAADEVIFLNVSEVLPRVEDAMMVCADRGIRTTVAADFFGAGLVRAGVSHFAGMPLIHFHSPPGDGWELSVKRFVDVAVSSVLLLLLSPLLAAVAVAVRLDSPGPALFKHRRVGLHGRTFNMYKFRSMRVGAEAQQGSYAALNDVRGPAFKLRVDPRVTRVGALLRRHSLDELPQLWNVLRGDMSLVGPRPPTTGEERLYERKMRRRLSMRPGLTCIWQVSGRSDVKDFEKWVEWDLEYIDNWSLGLDLRLLWRTIPAVLFGEGAR